MKRLIVTFIVLAVGAAGCANTPAGGNAAKASVSASEAALAAAGRVILACYTVPSCNAVAPKAKIKAAYDQAYSAVVTAQASADSDATPDLTAETAAVAALQGLIATLPTT